MVNALPPGISCNSSFKFHAGGGEEKPWFSFPKTKYYTNAFIVQDTKVLLGYKKRGFGMGKYNGFGGKVEPGETPLQAAVRELEEESGVTAPLEHTGSFLFYTEGTEWAFHIDIFIAESYEGIVTESDEMRPEWFSTLPATDGSVDENGYQCIPFAQMWETDSAWFPLLLSKKKFIGRADFTKVGQAFIPNKWWYGVVSPEENSD